jgi:hypothetical protein
MTVSRPLGILRPRLSTAAGHPVVEPHAEEPPPIAALGIDGLECAAYAELQARAALTRRHPGDWAS